MAEPVEPARPWPRLVHDGGPARPAAPQNFEAEQALLGAILVNNGAFHRVSEFLLPEHFAEAVNGRIFGAVAKLIDRGQIANPVTLKTLFDQDGALAEIGGAAYLARLAASVVTIINAEDYGRHILECWQRRRLMTLADDLLAGAADMSLDRGVDAIIAGADEALQAVAERRDRAAGLRPVGQHVDAALAHIERAAAAEGGVIGVPSGLVDLDRVLGGFMAAELTILAGRPKMGKSTVAKTVALHAARQGYGVGYFSLEMSGELLGMALLADLTGVPMYRQRGGRLQPGEGAALARARDELAALSLLIDDAPGITLAYLRSQCRRLKRRGALDIVFVDHLGHMAPSAEARRQSRTSEVTEISGGLLRLAKELQVPVVALSQLSRAVEQRDDKRPTLADLRDSGSIEQDAHNVVFVYRPEYYLERERPVKKASESAERFTARESDWHAEMDQARGVCELIVAASRTGPTETVGVYWDPERSRVGNLDKRGF